MKYYTTEMLFKYPWEQTMAAVWQRYPNPFSWHVLSEDTILRRVEGPLLFTKRILVKTNPIPKWGQRFVHARHVVIVEESVLDRDAKTLITYTRNTGGYVHTISAVEKCIYDRVMTSDEKDSEITRLKREAWIDSPVRGFSGILERFGIERYKHNSSNASKGLNYALARVFPHLSLLKPGIDQGMAAAGSKFKLAAIQLAVGADKLLNVQRAVAKIGEAVSNGANVVVLPECFNAPYGNQYFRQYSEHVPGPTTDSLAEAARKHQIYLIGGSLPEAENDKLYNTCPIFNRTGELLAKFRKVHLFDIDVPGKITFKESESLTAGAIPIILDTDYCKIGIGICYDVRFQELARIYGNSGCQLLVYPGAFNMTTGPAHWELLARSRALDQQSYFCWCSPARDENASYVAYGHSMIVDPWGVVVAQADEKESIIYADIDMSRINEIRTMIPISKQGRKDIYETVAHKPPMIVK